MRRAIEPHPWDPLADLTLQIIAPRGDPGCHLRQPLRRQAGDLSTVEVEQRNMEIIRQAHESLAAGDLEAFKSTISPNYTRHCHAMPPGLQELHGTEKLYAFIEEFIKACPGYTDSLSKMIADGDRVAYVSTMTGTQTGPMGGFPATGKTFTLVNIIMQRIEDGKVVETWVSWGLCPDHRMVGNRESFCGRLDRKWCLCCH